MINLLSWMPVIGDLIDTVKKFVPDRAQQDEMIGKINQTIVDASAQQAAITMAEVNSADKFKSRWRPFIGWVCGAGIAIHFLVFPLTSMLLLMAGHPAIASPVDVQSLMALVMTLLGLGGMRMQEKIKGAA